MITKEKRNTKYWIISASKDHVKTGIAEGIAQACHGKVSPLRRMRKIRDAALTFWIARMFLFYL